MSDKIHTAAPAKVNLGLAVLGRRPDGYHDLLSVFQAVSWSDEITLTPSGHGITLTCSAPELPVGPENLVWRAAELVRSHFRIQQRVAIHLEKRIPHGAGLGGGSSDAAATMRGLADLWGIGADVDEWLGLCAQIGSDVPFFWRGGTAVVEGRGERVTPLPPQEDVPMVVAVPPVQVSTSWAYGQLRPPFPDSSAYRERVRLLAEGAISLRAFCVSLSNDFEPVIERALPAIRDVRTRLADAGAVAAVMSGSGAAVVGVFAEQDDARRALQALHGDIVARQVSCVPSTPKASRSDRDA